MHRVPIVEISQVAEARRLATQLAHELDFAATDTARVALVVTEAATNLVKHATGGQLLMQALSDVHGVELLALDTGPGIRHMEQCLQDGYSTADSLGTGLGAITRLATLWDIYSVVGMGTALLMHILPSSSVTRASGHLDIGAVCLPKAGEVVCGDAWTAVQQIDRSLILVVDGLGHGPEAARAAQVAIRLVQEHSTEPLARLLERLHRGLQHTRGAVVALARVDLSGQEMTFAGIGNMAGRVIASDNPANGLYLMSHNGTVGYQIRKVQALTYPWSDNALLVLHSDGLATRWDLRDYPGLTRRHPSLIAGVLYRDFARGLDDVIVVVARRRHALTRAREMWGEA